MKNRILTISDTDRRRLKAMIESARYDASVRRDYLDTLEGELKRAHIVPRSEVPASVITMNSKVRLRDLDLNETETYTLVYPADADVSVNRISIIAPIGTALLGYREGDVIEWPVPAGIRRIKVMKVLHEPERAGVLQA